MPQQLPIDMLNDSSKEIIYVRKNRQHFKRLARETHFNLQEVEALALIHKKICKERGSVSRGAFHEILHFGLDFTENIRHLLIDRVFSVIDSANEVILNVEQWVKGLSILLRGTLKERMEFAYKVYDLTMTDKIKKEQIFTMMRGCLINVRSNDNGDEAVKDLIDYLLKATDVDRDGYISKKDFENLVQNNKLFLECMGPVFPSRDLQHAFLTTFSNNIKDF